MCVRKSGGYMADCFWHCYGGSHSHPTNLCRLGAKQEGFAIYGLIFLCNFLHKYLRIGCVSKIPSMGRLWVTLFTDGIIYYLLFLVNMIANVIILFGLPVQYSDFLNPFQGVIHSVLSCRVILNLRAAGSRQDSLLGETSQSLQFAMQQRAGTTSSSSTSTVVQIANSRNIDEEHGVDDQT
ncbi:hypothetical protein SERLADRAFT_459594 [Serpula lacrymans var. lacrymans S7.9]|uniref:Uncharacterized protein n=1 Tax=Serpula lacrymans var. lacrymans (strain S7.9) TaxID=578457 RepID=F8NKL9_SERL9|nr:uncharacterized protein SERLADRAFT_459594 [Serpula lacrymans var. lacrymans S7.9]EGO28791.1 hypothetical protein SERLADRAFT_459594 [Serpula lacrymans var. lacrymans S7.9]